MKRIIITAAVLLFVFSLTAANATPPKPQEPPDFPQWGMRGPGGGMGGAFDGMCGPGCGMGGYMMQREGMMRHCQDLDLDDKQQTKLDKIRLSHQREMVKIDTEMSSLHGTVKLLITGDNLDKNEVGKVVDRMSALQKDLMNARINHMREVRDILTPEQRVKFDSKILSGPHGGEFGNMEKMHKMRGMRRHRPW